MVKNDAVWCQRVLKHWLLGWIRPWGSIIQTTAFEKIFYNPRFPHNEWHGYERRGGPQMFASSSEEIITIGEDALLLCNTKVTNPMNTNYKAFLRATKYQSGQSISKDGIKLGYCRPFLDLVVQDNDFVYGYPLKNPRKILAEWQSHGRRC